MKRKILHLITSLEGGGTENFLHQILAHSPNGYEHRVVYLKKEGIIGDRIRTLGIQVRSSGSLLGLFNILRNYQPDILHTCLYRAHLVGRVIGRLAGVKRVVSSQRAIDSWHSSLHTALDRMTLPLADAVIVNSEAARELIERRRGTPGPPRIFIIPNGVDLSRLQRQSTVAARTRYGLPVQAVVGGTLMRLHSEKGADLIPLFAERALSQTENLHLLIGGIGPLEQTVKERCTKIKEANRIHFVGWQEDIAAFLSACDFIWSLSREESFPQSLVEASAFGLPWIAPEVGGIPELLKAGAIGQTFPRLNIVACVNQTKQLLENLENIKSQADLATSRIQEIYSLPRMISRVYEALEHF